MYKFYYLTRKNWLTGRYKKLSFPGHAGSVVTWLLFDDDKIVSGSDDQSIHIYDIRKGELSKKLIGHQGGVWALQYYGSTLVSGSTDRSVRVWNMDTGRCTHIFEGHTSTVRCLLIVSQDKKSPNTSFSNSKSSSPENISRPVMVTGSRDTTLRVWSLPELDTTWFPSDGTDNPYLIHTLRGHTNSVRAIAGHENILVSGSYDTSVRIWNLETGDCIHTCNGHREKVYSVGYSHELKRAVSGSMDSTVKVWDSISGENLFTLEGHNSLVGLLELTTSFLVSAAADSTLRIWCPHTGKCLAILQGHDAAITCFHHDPENNRLVSGSDGGVKVWELSSVGYGSSNVNDSMIMPSSSLLSKSLPFTQTCEGPKPVHGRFIGDLVKDVQGVWKTRMDTTRLVCAVQDTERRTWFEVLDFSEGEGLGTSRKTAGDRFYRDPDDEMDVDDSEDDSN
jgi:F-box and WD-40 domain protein CDC4